MQHRTISFRLGGMQFEYDEDKNAENIRKHGISFRNAARVFFDYDRIEFFDKEIHEDRYDTIGDTSAGYVKEAEETSSVTMIGNVEGIESDVNDIIYVVYTERYIVEENGTKQDITRLISARMATNFERGLYYGKCD